MNPDKYTAAIGVAIESLARLPNMPFVELNPDGEDQARESMRLVAREGLVALGVLSEAIADDSEHMIGLLREAHKAIGDLDDAD